MDLQPHGAQRRRLRAHASRDAKGLAALDSHWSYERGGTLHIQASESPVWDTLLALLAMQDCDREFTPAMERALDWVLANEVRYPGDWTKKVKRVEPSGWAFERANLHYPDIDDTAVALIVLSRLPRQLLDEPRIRATIDRALGWTLAMQSSNGGWAAFDKDNDRPIITKIPFCDFGEALDPPSADVTAHVLEALGCSASIATIRPSRAAIASSAPSRRPTAAGSAAGASTTSTARPPCCLRSRRSART